MSPAQFWEAPIHADIIEFQNFLLQLKGPISCLRQFLGTESPSKMTKNAFYFTSKAFFVLKIFKFLSRCLGFFYFWISWVFSQANNTNFLGRRDSDFKNKASGKNFMWLFYYFNFDRNYDVLKSKRRVHSFCWIKI